MLTQSEPATAQNVETRILSVLERLRPYLNADGGDVQFLGFDHGHVKLRMQGSCNGCPSSHVTLRDGIERALLAEIPEVMGVEAIG